MAANAATKDKAAARSAGQRAASTRADRARRAGEKIKVTLAHHLSEDNPFTGQAQKPEDEISVTRSQARSLLAAGYLQADPEDPDAVAKVLRLEDDEVLPPENPTA